MLVGGFGFLEGNDFMATQQDVIKKFMAALDTTTLKGTAALDEAINYATSGTRRPFSTIAEAISAMKADITATDNADTFLKDVCGIDLSNEDTGAITGSDMGGSVPKTAQSIVLESGSVDKTFKDNSIDLKTKYGITIYLSEFNDTGGLKRLLSFDDLTPKQQYIWQAFKTWWAEGALNLITESYGSNFGFASSSLVEPKGMYFGFYNRNDSSLAESGPWLDDTGKEAIALSFRINMNSFEYVNTIDSDGSNSTGEYLDRTLAHEFTHCVMAANINYYQYLPQFIREGMAELTIGADDGSRTKENMRKLADKSSLIATNGNKSLLDTALDLNNMKTGEAVAYDGGYMFLHWLAKQASQSSQISDGIINNTLSNTLISGTDNADTIYNEVSGSYVTIVSGAGDDSIINGGANASIIGGTGNDTISNKNSNAKNSTLLGNAGNDYIPTFGERSLIDGGNDSDTIYVGGEYSTVTGGDGSDLVSVTSFGSHSTISGGKGNDTITNNGGTNILFQYATGDGNDTITGFNANSTLSIIGSYSTAKSGDNILVTVGDGKITLVGAASLSSVNIVPTITSFRFTEGNDSYSNTVSGVSLDALGGNDTITNTYSNVTIYGGAGKDSIVNTNRGGALSLAGAYSYIDAGEDDDYVLNYDWAGYSFVSGGSGKDTIFSRAANSTILGGDDNDSIQNITGEVSINGGAGNDIIIDTGNSSHDNTIVGGAGNDLISLGSSTKNNLIQYTKGDGNDTIVGLKSTDTISISGSAKYSRSTVDSSVVVSIIGSGAMTLDGAASLSSINIIGGSFINVVNNSTASISIVAGTGEDSITNRGNKVTVVGASDADSVWNYGNNSSINGNGGVDYLYNKGSNVTISGGAGDDSLKNFGGSKVSINGGNDNDYLYSDSLGSNISMLGGSDNDEFNNWSSKSTLLGGNGNDTVYNNSSGESVLVDGGAGADSIRNFGNDSTLLGGDGNDVIGNYEKAYQDGKLVAEGVGKNVTIVGGKGNDSIYNSGENVLFKYAIGDGNDTITGFNATSTLQVGNGTTDTYSKTPDNGDLVFTVGEEKITLQGAASLSALNILGTEKKEDPTLLILDDSSAANFPIGAEVVTVDATARTKAIKIVGNKLANSIKSGTSKDTLVGGDGNDYLNGNSGADSLSGGNGNDKLYGGSGNDTLLGGADNDSLNGGAGNDKLSGGDGTDTLIGDAGNDSLNGGAGNDKLSGGDGKDTLIGGTGNDKLSGGDGKDTLLGGSGNDTLTGGDGEDIFIYSSGKDVITDYVSGEDKISLGAAISSVSLSGDDAIFTVGKNTLTIKDAKYQELTLIDADGNEFTTIIGGAIYDDDSAKNVTLKADIALADATERTTAIKIVGNKLDNEILGGNGKDSLYGGDGNDYISGFAGNDKLYGQNGDDTLWGGSGNDTLTGGDGADTFIYNIGEGKDVISDFANDDMLQITGTFSAKYNETSKTIAFKVGLTANAITLKNFTADTFNINGNSYHISGNKLVK